LHFHLAGINNQNFLMRDEETGSFWQQITGAAIAGPLKGEKLTLVPQDELTFGLWKTEQPKGTVLAPSVRDAAHYEKATWEKEIAKAPTVIHGSKGTLPDRETILGIALNGTARAFPLSKLTSQSPVLIDEVGEKPVVLILGPDGKSVRAFSRETATGVLEFYGRGGGDTHDPWELIDSDSLSEWNFSGCAIAGPRTGQCLSALYVLKDFWFDWQNYHPESSIYRR
jgi:Protein of unknown function (DUF3179)